MNNVTVTQAIATNNMQRPATISTSGASPNWTTGPFSFDGSNNIVKMGADWFVYDPVSRIKTGKVYGATLQQDYTYDAFGFITSITTTPGGTQSFTPVSGTNHISGTNNYDAAGNMLYWGSYTYSWDRLNKLQKLTTPTEHWYFYSADGERVVEREGLITSPTTTTLTIRGLDGKVLRIYTKPSGGSFSWTKDYVYRDGQLLATVDSGGTKHFHLDHLGTPRWITNASAAKVAGPVSRRRAGKPEEPGKRRAGRRDPAASGEGRRDHDGQRAVARAHPASGNHSSEIVAQAFFKADIGKQGSCHLFRHTAATLMLKGGAEIRSIQQMLGHASLDTTQIYTRVSIHQLKAVHDATHPGARIKRRHAKGSADQQGDSELFSPLGAEE